MKKDTAKSPKQAKKKAAAKTKQGGKQVDLEVLRQKIANRVGNKALGMVSSTINEVGKGHYPAMKYLFEMIGLYPEGGQGELPQGEDALAKTLLRRLELPEESAAEEKVTKESEAAAVEEEGNHVE